MGRSKVAGWLKDLPLAPEYHPSEEEFQNPIAYIMKIEEEASRYGICKIVPPFGKASKKEVLWNLTHSLSAHRGLDPSSVNGNSITPSIVCTQHQKEDLADAVVAKGAKKAKISTRLQQLGINPRRSEGGSQYPAQKMVWETGEEYTLEQYEAKAKYYAEAMLSRQKDTTPLVLETLFWKAAVESATYIEYANDIPGTAFADSLADSSAETSWKGLSGASELHVRSSILGLDCKADCCSSERFPEELIKVSNHTQLELAPSYALEGGQCMENELFKERKYSSSMRLATSAWNMRYFARSPGSLLRFLPDDVPGVTSPMVYLGMLFSWFAWHIEDHELHSINYLHMGQSKTWYSVSSVAATAFEEFVRVRGYGGLPDNRATLELLGAKTTIMSPEVLIAAGLPCCRLVQNAGDYVITFPRAYHLGFSHGFNCGEAANFATPTWLRVAKEAAWRRASMKHLPMLSHQQLLYSMAMSLATRSVHESCHYAPTCRDLGEDEIKKKFVEDAIYSNHAIFRLLSTGMSTCVSLRKCQYESSELGASEFTIAGGTLFPATISADTHPNFPKGPLSQIVSMEALQNRETLASEGKPLVASSCKKANHLGHPSTYLQYDWGTSPCTVCGILSFANFAIIQPLSSSLQGKAGNSDTITPTSETATPTGVAPQAATKWVSIILQDHSKFVETKDLTSHSFPPSGFKTGMVEMNDLNAEVDNNHLFSQQKQILKDYSDASELDSGHDAFSDERGCEPCSQNLWRPKLFCLEHALIVQNQLQRFGGSEVLVFCSSRYSEILRHAKDLAEYMKLSYMWKDFPISEVSLDQLKLYKAVQEHQEGGNQECFHWSTFLGTSAVETGDPVQEVQESVSKEMKKDTISSQASKRRKKMPDDEMAFQKVRLVDNEEEISSAFEEKTEQLLRCMETPNASTVSDVNAKCGETAGQFLEKRRMKIFIRLKRHANGYPNSQHKQTKVVQEECLDEVLGSDSRDIMLKGSHVLAGDGTKDQEDAPEIFQRVHSSKNFSGPTSIVPKADTALDTSFPKEKYRISKENKKDGPFQNALECQILSLSQGKHRVLKRKGAGCSTPHGYSDKSPSVCFQSSIKDGVARETDGTEPNGWKTSSRTMDRKFGCNFKSTDDHCERPKHSLHCGYAQHGMKHSVSAGEGAGGVPAAKHCEKDIHKRSIKNRYECKLDGCTMSFSKELELTNHTNNVCILQGCGKQFSTHKYLVQHQRVHMDIRPLKCLWPGCEMSFKWAWARTEHMRVHTGARPYSCSVCTKTYRFLSDFSRHKRTSGHNTKE